MSTAKKLEKEEQELIDALKRISDGLGNKLTREQVGAVLALSRSGVNPEGIALALKTVCDAQEYKDQMELRKEQEAKLPEPPKW